MDTAQWNSSLLEFRRVLGLTTQRREQLSWDRNVLFVNRESYEVCKKAKWALPMDDMSSECKGFFDLEMGIKYLIPIEELHYDKS